MVINFLHTDNFEIWDTMSNRELFNGKKKNPWLVRLDSLVLEHMDDPDMNNSFLANKMSTSEANFYRLVRNLTDQSPNHYIRDVRLEVSKTMLESGQIQKLKDVALKVGFSRVDYFSKLYEQKYGYRPIELIKKINI